MEGARWDYRIGGIVSLPLPFSLSTFSCLKCGYKCLKWNEVAGRQEDEGYTLNVAEWKGA